MGEIAHRSRRPARHVDRSEEALKAAQNAESLWRGLAEKQPDAYTAEWATSLGNLGAQLDDVGRSEEALKAAEKAESLWRGLAEKQPDAYTAEWAALLNNLGGHLRDVGRFEEALKAAEKAESLWRGLAKSNPTYTADWATSLDNLADSQLAFGEFANALETAKTAIGQISAFAGRYPPVYNSWLGFARRIAAESYFKMEGSTRPSPKLGCQSTFGRKLQRLVKIVSRRRSQKRF